MFKKLFYYYYLVLNVFIVITLAAKSLLCTEDYCNVSIFGTRMKTINYILFNLIVVIYEIILYYLFYR